MEKKKTQDPVFFFQMVMPMRLELTRVAPLPPQSSVSAIPPRHHLRMILYYTSNTNSSKINKKIIVLQKEKTFS